MLHSIARSPKWTRELQQLVNVDIAAVVRKITVIGIVFTICCLAAPVSLAAEITPDYAREQRLIEEAEAGLFDGEIVYIPTPDREVFALLSEPDDPELNGIVILLHGRGFHPDWPQVVGPLREGFTDLSIPTLSVQMPVLAKDAKYYEYLEIIPESFGRIEAAIDYLQSAGYSWIAIVAHSCSVHMTMAWIKQSDHQGVDAYVGIGMGATDYRQPMLEPFPFERLSVPVLDLFGSEDYPAVTKAAVDRLAAIQAAGNSQSAQLVIDGADHFFEDYEDKLVAAVSKWVLSVRQ